jgi:Fe-S-cluster containining protein
MRARGGAAARQTHSHPAETDLAKVDGQLLSVVDTILRTAAGEAGSLLTCHPGCTECCSGPFPINRLDAWRLRRGLSDLAGSDPERCAAVVERARQQIEMIKSALPGDPESGELSGDRDAEDRFFEVNADLPCPALDQAKGTCDLYSSRPISCRAYGPPVRFGNEALPPCHMCFQGASPETMEACRVEPDPHGIERAIVDRLKSDGHGAWETIVAYAIARNKHGD